MSPPRRPAAVDRPLDLTSGELATLTSVPDAEQRVVQYLDLLRRKGVEPPTNLSVAENVLLYPHHLRPCVFEGLPPISARSMKYVPPIGDDAIRDRMADFLRRSFHADIEARNVFATAGASSALECVAFALREAGVFRAGDTVLLPAPCWQGFRWSFEQRPDLRCVPVDLLEAGQERFELTLADLRREYENDQHRKPRLLVLTNPHNPLGVNYERELLEEIYRWALNETDMHVISDEIYRHSQLHGARPEFVSAFALRAYEEGTPEQRQRVHLVWGFAKDFGLSGFRAAFLVSTSPVVHRAMLGVDTPRDSRKSLSWFSPFDSLKHHVLGRLLTAKTDGQDFAVKAMTDYRSLLTSAFGEVEHALIRQDIPFVHPVNGNSAVFFWLDLRRHLPPASELDEADIAADPVFGLSDGDRREQWLAREIARHARVVLLPGRTLHCRWPGYFRLCFTAEETPTVRDAVERLGEFLRTRARG
ncbi:1-aminocyclopropane-1-carboxylate synthase [Streptoalloteichus tenebrarius]|uniref:Aminotransferase n=1 Tax=Streptoalloteichus tenebrarius (strain ATCC 17920 / DSM 40477 / JCM 4838 / CBS 697.72 / NBRC 16177 / NCIMB 11028 / NRRL B-12390 / A12253. 1 / ISP 5477) TaxID=1933 RepID=A0ABT1I4K9_STRSD|nr:pyridoxal phosphate-dependent aminotransferase [Streptoalloteichus tenebrarius]MCP2262505.1 1-aminocyclopropane-1-carboxylate synthase [Streptoalloteichus tenebrarius]BFE99657.1 hypothetical protein GCM10020241_13330 [Streptoalloteichus tenebrarius]